VKRSIFSLLGRPVWAPIEAGKMKVAINALAQSPHLFSGSLSQYLQMAEMLPALDPATDYALLVRKADAEYYREHAAGTQVVSTATPGNGVLARLVAEHSLLGRVCAREQVDVLFHASSGSAPLMLPSRTKLVLAVWAGQAPDTIYLPLHKRFYRSQLARPGIARATELIFNSQYSRNLFLERYRVDAPSTIIHHGVDPRLFYPTRGPKGGERAVTADPPQPYVLFVGQIYPYKQLHILAEAFSKAVLELRLPHRLVVTGSFAQGHNREDEGYRRRIQDILARYGMGSRIDFFEGVPVRRLRELYADADLYVQSSTAETFGRTVIEAMACGAPVLAARAAATPEVLGEAGVYYEPHDVEDCAAQIGRMLSDPALRAALRERGLQHARSFSRESEMQAMARVFHRVGSQPS
jgi:glycosyltransferase involved in cell wall biosynthesis